MQWEFVVYEECRIRHLVYVRETGRESVNVHFKLMNLKCYPLTLVKLLIFTVKHLLSALPIQGPKQYFLLCLCTHGSTDFLLPGKSLLCSQSNQNSHSNVRYLTILGTYMTPITMASECLTIFNVFLMNLGFRREREKLRKYFGLSQLMLSSTFFHTDFGGIIPGVTSYA